jgi:hypothetical protein
MTLILPQVSFNVVSTEGKGYIMLGQGCGWWSFTLMSEVSFLSALKASLWLGPRLVLWSFLLLVSHVPNATSIGLHDDVHEELTLNILTSCELL